MGFFSATIDAAKALSDTSPRVARQGKRLRRGLDRPVKFSKTDDGLMADFQTPGRAVERPSVAVLADDGKVSKATLREDPPSNFDYVTHRDEAEMAAWNAAEDTADDLGIDATVTGHIGQENAPHAVVREPMQVDDFIRFEQEFRKRLSEYWPDDLYVGDP